MCYLGFKKMIWLTRLPFWPKHFVDLEVVTSLVDYPSGCQKCNVKERNITEIRLHLINHSYPKHRYIWKLFLKLIVDTKLLSTILSKINLSTVTRSEVKLQIY